MQQTWTIIPRQNYPVELTGRQSPQPARKPFGTTNETQKVAFPALIIIKILKGKTPTGRAKLSSEPLANGLIAGEKETHQI